MEQCLLSLDLLLIEKYRYSMTHFKGSYLGNKKISLTHLESNATIQTSAPKDNQGDGSAFSPTDLFASSLGACQLTVMSIYAERSGISLAGSYFEVEKIMSDVPRRVKEILVTTHLPNALTEDERKKLESISETCPVKRSLHPDIIVKECYCYDV